MKFYTEITEIFCQVDDFCKEFEDHIKKQVLASGKRRRNRPSKLSDSEIITILYRV